MKKLLTLPICILCFSLHGLSQYDISTVAGNGYTSYCCDGSPATSALMNQPYGVAIDGSGNVYIADQSNNRIRMVNTSGIISTFAGNGVQGYYGDGGASTAAELRGPDEITFDASGNLYIGDGGNNVIRMVNTSGVISTFAGNGTAGYSGDAGPATAAELFYPGGVSVDALGNVYISDENNYVIRMVNTSGIISTFAGTGSQGFSGDGGPATAADLDLPLWVTIDASNNLYIADNFADRIRMVNTSGIISTFAGNGTLSFSGDGGPATAAEIYSPTAVWADASGNVYIADENNKRVRMVNTSNIISTFAGNGVTGYYGDGGPATAAELNGSEGMATDASGNVYIADAGNNIVRMVNTSGTISTFAGFLVYGYGDGGPATSAEFSSLTGVALDNTGDIYVADQSYNRIRMVNTSGIISAVAGNGVNGYSGDGGPATAAEMYLPQGIALDAANNVFIADFGNNSVREVNSSGNISTYAGNGIYGYSGDGGPATAAELKSPGGIAPEGLGNVYIAEQNGDRIRLVNSSGIISTFAGNGKYGYSGDGGPATAAEFKYPWEVAVDGLGNVYVDDYECCVIRMINTSGIISTIAGNGVNGYYGDGGPATAAELSNPQDVIVDASGNLYISDLGNSLIRMVNTSGIISTIAGNYSFGVGFSGDGGPATSAELNYPWGVAENSSGNIYITDQENNRVRLLTNTVLTGVQELKNNGLNVTIYPNPNNGAFTIEMKSEELRMKNIVEIYNVLGEKVYSHQSAGGPTFQIDISSQPKGIYLYRVISEAGKVLGSGKVIIQK